MASRVKKATKESHPIRHRERTASLVRYSLRNQRTSFDRDTRRSKRVFNANAPIDLRVIDALKARERTSGAHVEVQSAQQQQEEDVAQQIGEESWNSQTIVDSLEEEWQPKLEADRELLEKSPVSETDVQAEDVEATGPPQNTADLLKALKASSQPPKHNRPTSIFERQTDAQRIEFGDGFDESQPGPSRPAKDKEERSPRKRSRQTESDDESEEEAFETVDRSAWIHELPRKTPVAKRVRIDPFPNVPTSHQPSPRSSHGDDYVSQPHEQEILPSTSKARDVIEEEGPPSSYQMQHRLALQNGTASRATNQRKPRTDWSTREEEVFVQYMGIFPAQYSLILQHDKTQIDPVLQSRTQVNLKDKARTMAVNMIKSGTGLLVGFEEIVKPNTKHGMALINSGFQW